MKRLNRENINTSEHFDAVFEKDFHYYDSYQNIHYYNGKYNLRLFSGGTYLDYGCGSGASLLSLKQKFLELGVVGVDISEYVIKENRKRYSPCRFFTAGEYLVSDFVSEHILSSHVFEHLESPKDFAIYLLARTSETLTIIVPYKDSWIDCQEHLWIFDEKSFDFLHPSLVIRGLTNPAGNTEIIFHWDKKKNGAVQKSRGVKFIKSESYYGKRFFSKLRNLLPPWMKRSAKQFFGLRQRS